MMTNPESAQNASLARLFRAMAALAVAKVVANVVFSIITKTMVGFFGDIDTGILIGYHCFEVLVHYGIKIGLFVCLLAAAKHFRPSPTLPLLRAGGIVGVIGALLTLCILLFSTVYSYIDYTTASSDPSFSEEGFMKVLLILCANPLSMTVLPKVDLAGLALCAVYFFSHPVKTIRITAIALAAALGMMVLLAFVPMDPSLGSRLSIILGFASNLLTVVLFVTLAKSHTRS